MILGENHFISIADDGAVRFIKRIDYSPMCFHCFIIGWYWGKSFVRYFDLNFARNSSNKINCFRTASNFDYDSSNILI